MSAAKKEAGGGRKRGLGRGLNALFNEADAVYPDADAQAGTAKEAPAAATAGAAGAAGPKTLPLEKLVAGQFQPRTQFDEDALKELAASIKENGLIQPILVRPLPGSDNHEIIAGERRWRACQLAQLHDVPVVIREYNDTEALQVALVENLQREDLNPLEEAAGLQRLIDEFGHRQEEVAQAVGKSRPHVANTLRLLGLEPAIRDLVTGGKLSAGHARALIGVPDAVILAQNVAARGLSVRETEKLAKARKEGTDDGQAKALKKAAASTKDADILALEHGLSMNLGLKVSIEGAGQKGKVIVEYQTLEQLDDLLQRFR